MSDPVITLSPYAGMLGVRVDHWEGGLPVLAMDFSEAVSGNVDMFHGGVLGGMLEMAAMSGLEAHLQSGGPMPRLRLVTITIDYLRPAGPQALLARAEILRTGRRLANVQVRAWQEDAGKPVVTAFVNVALERGSVLTD